MNLLVAVLNAYNIHVLTQVCVHTHVFLGVYDRKNDIIRGNLCVTFICVGVFLRIILTECPCRVSQTCVVVTDAGPPPGVCERSADTTSGQDNARAAPTLPLAL